MNHTFGQTLRVADSTLLKLPRGSFLGAGLSTLVALPSIVSRHLVCLCVRVVRSLGYCRGLAIDLVAIVVEGRQSRGVVLSAPMDSAVMLP